MNESHPNATGNPLGVRPAEVPPPPQLPPPHKDDELREVLMFTPVAAKFFQFDGVSPPLDVSDDNGDLDRYSAAWNLFEDYCGRLLMPVAVRTDNGLELYVTDPIEEGLDLLNATLPGEPPVQSDKSDLVMEGGLVWLSPHNLWVHDMILDPELPLPERVPAEPKAVRLTLLRGEVVGGPELVDLTPTEFAFLRRVCDECVSCWWIRGQLPKGDDDEVLRGRGVWWRPHPETGKPKLIPRRLRPLSPPTT